MDRTGGAPVRDVVFVEEKNAGSLDFVLVLALLFVLVAIWAGVGMFWMNWSNPEMTTMEVFKQIWTAMLFRDPQP